jgi:hypothetical protein
LLYIFCFFNHCRPGSTVCEFTVQFENPKVADDQVTEAPPVENLNSEKIVNVFKEVIREGNLEETQNFEIDTNTFTVEGNL